MELEKAKGWEQRVLSLKNLESVQDPAAFWTGLINGCDEAWARVVGPENMEVTSTRVHLGRCGTRIWVTRWYDVTLPPGEYPAPTVRLTRHPWPGPSRISPSSSHKA